MYVNLFIVLLGQVLCNWTHCAMDSVFGSISGNKTMFIQDMFNIPPSQRAIIEVDVYYQWETPYQWKTPILGIYATQDHVNIKRRCTESLYGQVENGDSHLVLDKYHSRTLRCEGANTSKTHCTANITIQDFIPRTFSFSFGRSYDVFNHFARFMIKPLKGLIYNISIYGTNTTDFWSWV